MEHTEPLVCPTHKSHYFFIFIIALVLGGALGVSYGYQNGFDTAKKLVEQSSVGTIMHTPDDIRSLSGTVTGVQGNTIMLHVKSSDPFMDAALLDRAVAITGNTKIVKLTQKDANTIRDEMKEFASAVQSNKEIPLTPPAPYTSSSATVSDITTGVTITVDATENVKAVKTFTASEVRIQY